MEKIPYLVIPELIIQPTWGGNYIANLKNLDGKYKRVKIGQSYELSSKSKLSKEITQSNSADFGPESVGFPIKEVLKDNKKIPLLIKLNQALGNSFQLHINPNKKSKRWLPKPESWFFLEDGFVSLGLNFKKDLKDYKKACEEIEFFMSDLEKQLNKKSIALEKARELAKNFVKKYNPWQYVNLYKINKNSLIDLSQGAIHHSWEENTALAPFGNVVYEVQVEATDDEATIRSFDQGKIKDDLTIRKMNIKDYFENIDTNKDRNSLKNLVKETGGSPMLQTPYYTLDYINVFKNKPITFLMNYEFEHIFVRSGVCVVKCRNTTLTVGEGHSFFIPFGVTEYKLESLTDKSELLKTYISNK